MHCILAVQELLGRLHNVPKAKYNPELQCLQNTREEVIRDILQWAVSVSPPVYWLNGQAGTGKTAIATSISNHLEREGFLCGTFFFSRDEEELCRSDHVFSSIAYQMATSDRPAFVGGIYAMLSRYRDVGQYSLSDQFARLLPEALHAASGTGQNHPTVIVFDGLDECVTNPRNDIVRIVLDNLSSLPHFVKILMTSRPDPDIQAAFRRTRTPVKKRDLDEPTDADITELFNIELAHDCPPLGLSSHWLDGERLYALVDRARGSFLWAKAACDIIKYDSGDEPEALLQLILDPPVHVMTADLLRWPTLDKCYRQALDLSITMEPPPARLEQLREVLGTIILLVQPLSIAETARLLDLRSGNVIRRRLQNLQSIVAVPVDDNCHPSILHPSLSDFLTDLSRCSDERFYIDSMVHHGNLVKRCLGLMIQEGGRTVAADNMSGALCYASRYWGTHLSKSPHQESKVYDLVHDFVSEHLLRWLDVLASPDIARSLLDKAIVWAQVITSVWLLLILLKRFDNLGCRQVAPSRPKSQ